MRNIPEKKQGWFSSWYFRRNSSSSGSKHEDLGEHMELTEEQRKELHLAIEYNEEHDDILSSIDLPKDVCIIFGRQTMYIK